MGRQAAPFPLSDVISVGTMLACPASSSANLKPEYLIKPSSILHIFLLQHLNLTVSTDALRCLDVQPSSSAKSDVFAMTSELATTSESLLFARGYYPMVENVFLALTIS